MFQYLNEIQDDKFKVMRNNAYYFQGSLSFIFRTCDIYLYLLFKCSKFPTSAISEWQHHQWFSEELRKSLHQYYPKLNDLIIFWCYCCLECCYTTILNPEREKAVLVLLEVYIFWENSVKCFFSVTVWNRGTA